MTSKSYGPCTRCAVMREKQWL